MRALLVAGRNCRLSPLFCCFRGVRATPTRVEPLRHVIIMNDSVVDQVPWLKMASSRVWMPLTKVVTPQKLFIFMLFQASTSIVLVRMLCGSAHEFVPQPEKSVIDPHHRDSQLGASTSSRVRSRGCCTFMIVRKAKHGLSDSSYRPSLLPSRRSCIRACCVFCISCKCRSGDSSGNTILSPTTSRYWGSWSRDSGC